VTEEEFEKRLESAIVGPVTRVPMDVVRANAGIVESDADWLEHCCECGMDDREPGHEANHTAWVRTVTEARR
jgi:hypothetical protein